MRPYLTALSAILACGTLRSRIVTSMKEASGELGPEIRLCVWQDYYWKSTWWFVHLETWENYWHECESWRFQRLHPWNLLILLLDFLREGHKNSETFFYPCWCRDPTPPSPHHHQLLGWSNGESVGSCWPLIWLPAWPITPPAEKAYVVLEEAAAHQLHIFAKRLKKKNHKKGKCCILWEGRQGQTYAIITFKLYLTYTSIKNVSFASD